MNARNLRGITVAKDKSTKAASLLFNASHFDAEALNETKGGLEDWREFQEMLKARQEEKELKEREREQQQRERNKKFLAQEEKEKEKEEEETNIVNGTQHTEEELVIH